MKTHLSWAYREPGALHRHQLTLLANGEAVGPGPVGDGLRPGEGVPVLNHVRHHLVVGLGAEQPCHRAGEIQNEDVQQTLYEWQLVFIHKETNIPKASRNSS